MKFAIEQLQLDELQDYLREQADDAFPDLKDEQRLTMLAGKWHKNAEFCTCRDENDQLVGMIAFYANQPAEGVVYLPHIFVSREYRGKGVFSNLFVLVKQYARENSYSLIRLEVKKENIRAQRAYHENGFQIDGDTNEKSIHMTYKI